MKRIPESQIRYSASPDIIGPERNPNSYWTPNKTRTDYRTKAQKRPESE